MIKCEFCELPAQHLYTYDPNGLNRVYRYCDTHFEEFIACTVIALKGNI